MKKQFKRVSLLASAVIAALFLSGCGNSDVNGSAAETRQQTAAAVTSSVKDDTAEANVFEEEETEFVTEFEITGWTMEDLVDNMFLCGQKITLPTDLSDIKSRFDVSGYYDELLGETFFTISYGNDDAALFSCKGNCIDDDDVTVTNIKYGLNYPVPEFNIMGITESSSSDEVKKILGEPNYIQDDGNTYRYIFTDEKQLMLHFTEDEKAIDFYYVCYEE